MDTTNITRRAAGIRHDGPASSPGSSNGRRGTATALAGAASPVPHGEALRMLVERGRDLVYRYRLLPTPGFEYVSPSATRISGYTPEEHYADPELGFKLVHPDDRELLARAGTPDAPDPLVLRWVRRDGTVIWTEQHNVPVVDEAGRLVAIEGSARDVTARELARAAVTTSESRLRTLLGRVGLLAGSLDRDGKVTFANLALARTTGWAIDELEGADWFDTFVPPAARDGMRAAFEADIATGSVNRDIVTDLLGRDGSVRRVRLHVMGTHAEAGHLDGVAMLGEDLTGAEEVATRTEHLTAAIEQTADCVVITDAEGRIQYVNPAFEQITGYAYAEVAGENPRFLRSGHQPPAFYRRMWRRLAAGAPWSGELVNRRRDGSLYVEEATITPIVDVAGTVTAYVGVKRDVTRVRALRRSLDAARLERAEVVRAIAGLEVGESLEVTADGIAGALLSVPGVDAGTVILFEGDAAARVLAVSSEVALPLRAGMLLPDERASYLRERAQQGPWVEAWRARKRDGAYGRAVSAAGIRAVLYAPIANGSGPAGVITLSGTAPGAARELARSLPSAVEFATVARSLLGPMISSRRQTQDAARRIGTIIGTRGFHPVYQPIIELATGRPVGFEALTRFESGIRPDLVFAEARASGLGPELEAATLEAALTGTRWMPVGTWLSLNVSPALVMDGSRLADIVAARTRPIVVEITEHETVEDYAALRAALEALGPDIVVAADDAGAGVANLGHLVDLRPGFIKLDQSIVRDADTDLSRQAMVVGLRHFARARGAWLIAEGIETRAELEALRTLGVRYGQGYHLGRPARAGAWAGIARP